MQSFAQGDKVSAIRKDSTNNLQTQLTTITRTINSHNYVTYTHSFLLESPHRTECLYLAQFQHKVLRDTYSFFQDILACSFIVHQATIANIVSTNLRVVVPQDTSDSFHISNNKHNSADTDATNKFNFNKFIAIKFLIKMNTYVTTMLI